MVFEGAHAKTEPTLTPWEMQKLMGLGINLGNVLENPLHMQQSPTLKHFEMFHEAGFQNCRIPVCWGHHTKVDEPYTIDPQFLARVAELVKMSMDQGMVTIITAHHEWWVDFDDKHPKHLDEFRFKAMPRFEAMWKQIGEYFKEYRQLLLFGILNEPHMLSASSLNELHRMALVAIREANPSRIVTISGKDFANPRWLLEHPKALTIPRDPQLMLEIHVTEPHGFAGKDPTKQAWGSEDERERVKEWVDQIEVWGRARNLPIYVGEFGCSVDQKHETGRLDWLEANWKAIRAKGFCASLWDDGEAFSVYNRAEHTWDQDILTVLQRSLPGLQGVGLYRTGGGLGGFSNDPTHDMVSKLEQCFARLNHELHDVGQLPKLDDVSHLLGREYDSD